MTPSGIITLTTDFGTADGYAGALKGVLLTRFPGARIVDISHDIPPGDVDEAAWCLLSCARWFPPGTVHLAVVDPGVGSSRRALVVEGGSGHFFVGPDNGIFRLALGPGGARRAWRIEAARIRGAGEICPTFHGRDLFAHAAALIASGRPPAGLAGRIDPESLVGAGDRPGAAQEGQRRILHVDRFGNLVTDIPGGLIGCLRGGKVKRRSIGAPVPCYDDIKPGRLSFILGSLGLVEVSARRSSAALLADAWAGDSVTVAWKAAGRGTR